MAAAFPERRGHWLEAAVTTAKSICWVRLSSKGTTAAFPAGKVLSRSPCVFWEGLFPSGRNRPFQLGRELYLVLFTHFWGFLPFHFVWAVQQEMKNFLHFSPRPFRGKWGVVKQPKATEHL